jgi:plastocyanin
MKANYRIIRSAIPFALVFSLFIILISTGGCNYDDPFPPSGSQPSDTTDTTTTADTTGTTDTTISQPQTVEVLLQNTTFLPAQITVSAGTTVRWINRDAIPHTVTSDQNLFDSGNMNGGAVFEHRFEAAGTFPYHCRYHLPQMTGTVVVQ